MKNKGKAYDLTLSSSQKARQKKRRRLIWTNVISSFVLVVSLLALAGMSALNMRLFVDVNLGDGDGESTPSGPVESVRSSCFRYWEIWWWTRQSPLKSVRMKW